MQRDALGIESIAMHRVNAPLAQGVDTMMDEHSPAERALREAVLSVLDGAPVRDAAIRFGLQPEHVELAISRMGRERGGRLRLRASRTTHAERRSLSADAERALHALLRAGAPAAAGLPDSLWSKSVVRDLIERETGKRLPSRTLMAYLERWGFVPERPMRALAATQPLRMREWLRRDLPILAMQAREHGSLVNWWGCVPLQAMRLKSLRHGVPVAADLAPFWTEGSHGMVFLTTNRGHVRWLPYSAAPTPALVIDLFERAMAEDGRKLHAVVHEHPLMSAPELVAWSLRNKDRCLLHLVPIAPERSLNPRETKAP